MDTMEESLLRMTFMLDMYRDAGDMPGDDTDELERDRRGAIVVVAKQKRHATPLLGVLRAGHVTRRERDYLVVFCVAS
jgi:hypothetical protein